MKNSPQSRLLTMMLMWVPFIILFSMMSSGTGPMDPKIFMFVFFGVFVLSFLVRGRRGSGSMRTTPATSRLLGFALIAFGVAQGVFAYRIWTTLNNTPIDSSPTWMPLIVGGAICIALIVTGLRMILGSSRENSSLRNPYERESFGHQKDDSQGLNQSDSDLRNPYLNNHHRGPFKD